MIYGSEKLDEFLEWSKKYFYLNSILGSSSQKSSEFLLKRLVDICVTIESTDISYDVANTYFSELELKALKTSDFIYEDGFGFCCFEFMLHINLMG